MARRSIPSFAAVASLVAIACSESGQPIPAAPLAAVTSASTTCSFTGLNRLVSHYFGGTEAKAVRSLIDAMAAAGSGSTIAKDRGFDVLARIAANVQAGNARAQDASDLTNGLLACMFSDPADLPATFPEDFTVATDPAQHGGFEVRGGTTDPLTAAVFSRPFSAPFSGIAPPGANTWPGILGGNTAPARILFYGRPGPDPQTYDWKVVPRTAVFSPPVTVGVCVDSDVSTTSLLHEEHKGLLPFVDFAQLVPGLCSPFAARPSWSTDLASRLAGWGAELFGARTAWAATVVNPGGLGGSTGGIGSLFGPQNVPTVTLSFTAQPSDVGENQIITPAVVVLATATGTTQPVPNVLVTLVSQDNNGATVQLLGTVTGTTDGTGTVTFSALSLNKTGGYRLVASGSVNGRPAIGVTAGESERFNVRP